jgi:predicted nuclease of restriction endonuclease-like (RecB) superfamily
MLKKVGSGIAMLQRAKNFVPVSSLQIISNALIQRYFDYCSPLWDICGTQLLDKLKKFQNRAARIIPGASYEIDSAVVLETLGWENLKSRRQKMKSILLYKILNDYTAPNLKESLIGSSLTLANYNLRNIYTDLALSKPRREFPKKFLNTAGQSFEIAFLGKQKKHDQSIFSKKIFIFDSVTNVNVWVTPPVFSMHACK